MNNSGNSFARTVSSSRGLSKQVAPKTASFGLTLPGIAFIALVGCTPAVCLEPGAMQPDADFAANNFRYDLAPLLWSNQLSDNPPTFYYPNIMRPYMRRLKETYGIEELVKDARNDIDRVRIVCNWVHNRWQHQGMCPRQPNDPIAILEAAKAGTGFSCYEYSIVLAGCLNSIGIKTRIVVLLPRFVDQSPSGSYHVVAEAYLENRKKWVMADAQFNSVPTLNNYPLSIVELQNTLTRRLGDVDFGSVEEQYHRSYPHDILVNIHYLYTPLDNRIVGAQSPVNQSGGLMLVPLGDTPPQRFAGAPVGKIQVTHSVPDFYNIGQR